MKNELELSLKKLNLRISPELFRQLAQVIEQQAEINEYSVTKQSLPVAIQLLRMVLDKSTRSFLLGEEEVEDFPPDLDDLRIEPQGDTTKDGYQDIVVRCGSCGFGIRVELLEKPDRLFESKKPTVANLIFTIPLISIPQSELTPDDVEELLKGTLSEGEQEQFSFLEAQPGEVVLFHGLSTEEGFDLDSLVDGFTGLTSKMLALADGINQRLAKANPDSLSFYTDLS